MRPQFIGQDRCRVANGAYLVLEGIIFLVEDLASVLIEGIVCHFLGDDVLPLRNGVEARDLRIGEVGLR